jgi:hypothetical protein
LESCIQTIRNVKHMLGILGVHRTVDAGGTDGRPAGGCPVRQRWPRSRSATGVCGLTVESHVRDVSGRPGIGVVWRFYGSKAMNIFDPRTFAYLGMTTWGEQGQLGGDALVQTAIVDRAGEMP